jgi:hypothetical protein
MKIIEPHSRINPAEDPDRGQEDAVIQPIPLPRDGAARRPRRHRAEDRSWPATLERVLRSWPTTLRLALLLAILLGGLAAIVAAAGLASPLLLVAGGHQLRRWRRDARATPDRP